MRDELLEALANPAPGPAGPWIVEAPSAEITAIAAEIAERFGSRYHLSAGSGDGVRPLWAFPIRHDPVPRPVLATVEDLLYCREQREAAIERLFNALGTWLAGEPHRPKILVAEIFGRVTRDHVGFLRACCRRLTGPLRVVVLRHTGRSPRPIQAVPDRQADEILLALSLAGGYASAADLDRWMRDRRWDPATVADLTSCRDGGPGVVHTYRGSAEWSMAGTARTRTAPETVSALATMVSTAEVAPLLATVALGTDPAIALRALSRATCAVSAHRPEAVAAFGRAILRGSWRSGWQSEVDRSTAYALHLAAFVGVHRTRLSPAAADRVLGVAERTGVDAEIRSLLSYQLGQTLATARDPASWAASLRYSTYARTQAPASTAIRTAASYNGEALAYYRAGDRAGAIRAELAGLDVLTAPGTPATTAQAEQRTLLLANLADVYARDATTAPRAIRCGLEAVRIAVAAESLASLSYVVPKLVSWLLTQGRRHQAERVTTLLLRRFDRAVAPGLGAERAMVTACCRLAAAHLDADRVAAAAAWYAEAARRMRQAAPEAFEGFIRNLRARDAARAAAIIERVAAELEARRSIRDRLTPLLALTDRR